MNFKWDHVHTVMPQKIWMRKLGCAVGENTDSGHLCEQGSRLLNGLLNGDNKLVMWLTAILQFDFLGGVFTPDHIHNPVDLGNG